MPTPKGRLLKFIIFQIKIFLAIEKSRLQEVHMFPKDGY
jgi:hypothetical protein